MITRLKYSPNRPVEKHPAPSRLVIIALAVTLLSAGCSNKMSLNSGTTAANQGIMAGNLANSIGQHHDLTGPQKVGATFLSFLESFAYSLGEEGYSFTP